ncbi:cytochrome c oxidase subunit II [bacterium]|nr:cytochrome c oxidase subunit II [bacterium]
MLKKLNVLKIIAALGTLLPAQDLLAAADGWQMNLYKGVTPISRDIYHLHMIAIGVCSAIGIVVFGVMFYSLFKHRKSKGYKPATFSQNLHLEIIWTIIPFIILIGLAIPATTALIHQDNSDDSDITIKIVGYQWKWQYQYLDQGISFFSSLSTPYSQIRNKTPKGEWYLLEVDHPLVLPVHKKIRFIVTSADVVHSWWVPELGVKRDAIPGFMHEAWANIDTPGTYRGQCAELCGINHGFMPIVVQAVSEKDFALWVAKQKAPLPPVVEKPMTRLELMTAGKARYDLVCSACHQSNGLGMPPLFPALKRSSVAMGHPLSRHVDLILNGIPGSAMAAYADQLTDKEIAAIVTYERNAWGNNTNEEVQPADVAELRRNKIQSPIMVEKAQAGGFR